jgi:hypothetical protein
MRTLFVFAVCFVLISPTTSEAGGIFRHRGMVAASGIKPIRGGAEGVGRSTRSYADAIAHSCGGGVGAKNIQYNYRNGFYYVVVKY